MLWNAVNWKLWRVRSPSWSLWQAWLSHSGWTDTETARQPQDQFNLELHFYTLAGTGKDIQSFIFLFISWKRKTILHDPDGVLELVKLYFSPTPPPSTDRCLQLELYLFDSLKQVADSNKSSRCSSQKRPKTFFSHCFFHYKGRIILSQIIWKDY